jgi:hypothetical protein
MITVDVLTKNGVEFEETLILTAARIVYAKDPGTADETEILYAKSLDRRDRPDILVIDDDADGLYDDLLTAGFFEANVLLPDDTWETWAINPAFVEYITDSKLFWGGNIISCVKIEFTEAAFFHKTIFAQGEVSTGGEIVIVTTTTTTEVDEATTTTTPDQEEVTTTTTPEPAVTTTTTPEPEVTTTTTPEPAVTTTTTPVG